MNLLAALYLLIGGVMIGLAGGLKIMDEAHGRKTREPQVLCILGTCCALGAIVFVVLG